MFWLKYLTERPTYYTLNICPNEIGLARTIGLLKSYLPHAYRITTQTKAPAPWLYTVWFTIAKISPLIHVGPPNRNLMNMRESAWGGVTSLAHNHYAAQVRRFTLYFWTEFDLCVFKIASWRSLTSSQLLQSDGYGGTAKIFRKRLFSFRIVDLLLYCTSAFI